MRVKQQYWRTLHSPRFAKDNLLHNLNTVICLGKVLISKALIMKMTSPPLVAMLSSRFGLAQDLLERLMIVKKKRAWLRKKELIPIYEQIFTLIRELDRAAARVDA